jgi:pimeloyl-ACP methyl ester carboxylesterase
MRPRTCTAAPGVEITYRLVGDRADAPTIVFTGGLGGTHLVWSALTRALRDRYRVVIWDYPGLASGRRLFADIPCDIPALSGYQEAVLDAAGVDRAVLLGWSLGTQVAVEFTRGRAHRCAALIAVCGTAAPPFVDDGEQEPIAAAIGLRAAVPGAVGWISARADRIDALRSMLKRLDHPTRWAKRLGLVDPLTDELVFDAVIRDFIDLDPGTYRRYMAAASAHDASDLLPALRVPALVVAGERDRLVRASLVEELATDIAGSEYIEVRGATHFLPLEYSDLLALEIDDFLRRNLDR